MDDGSAGALAGLLGRRIRRIDLPRPELLAITVAARVRGDAGRRRAPAEEMETRAGADVLVASIAADGRGVGFASERPHGDPASSFVRKLRKELAGSMVADVAVVSGVVTLWTTRGEARWALVIELDGTGNIVLLDGEGRVVIGLHAAGLRARGLAPGSAWAPPEGARYLPPDTEEGLRRAGAAIAGGGALRDRDEARGTLDRALSRAARRLERRLEAIGRDAARAAEAPRLRADASAILAGLSAIAAGVSEARVTDWEADPPVERVVRIDPALGAKGTADALFHRARRLDRGVIKAEQRRRETEVERAAVDALRAELAAATDAEAIEAIAVGARRLGIRHDGARVGASRRASAERAPFKRFVGAGDRVILVGRGAADNDALTLRVAKPNDLWLHARGTAGAHVVVPLDRRETCPPELLLDAAHLAVHFSSARGEAITDVTHVERRHVRKPRGFPPGAVAVDRERVLALRVEPVRLARLLATEEGRT